VNKINKEGVYGSNSGGFLIKSGTLYRKRSNFSISIIVKMTIDCRS
jgi:hypothetical protein